MRAVSIFIMILLWFPTAFSAEKPCAECAALAKIEARAKKEMLKPSAALAPYSAEAAEIIVGMSKKTKILDRKRVQSIVSVMRTLAPKAPSHSLMNLTSQVLVDNQVILDEELAKLPDAEENFLKDALATASTTMVSETEETSLATPPPAPTPTPAQYR